MARVAEQTLKIGAEGGVARAGAPIMGVWLLAASASVRLGMEAE